MSSPPVRQASSVFIFLFFIFSPTIDVEATNIPEDIYQEIQKKAEQAVLKDKKEADFWIARYLGLASKDPASRHSSKDLEELLKKRRLDPKGFVSGNWDEDFIVWFEKGLYERWGVSDKKIRVKQRAFEIAGSSYKDKYFVTISACPETEFWLVLKNGIASRFLYLTMGNAKDCPTLFFGKLFSGAASFQFNHLALDVKKRSLHYVWKPEFYDLDGDGTPEVWIRFNLAWGNGFVQVLEIYRIQNDNELVLLKRFQSDSEGIARRLPDGSVELGSAFSGDKMQLRFQYDQTHLETWKYVKGVFEKVSETNIPFILQSSDWKKYFLESH